MYKSAKELIKGEVTPELELQIYYSVKNGIEVYKEFERENASLFMGSLRNNVMPRIVTYCIEKQFSPEMYIGKNNFFSQILKVNNFGYEVAEIRNNNIVIHFSKVKNGIFLRIENSIKRVETIDKKVTLDDFKDGKILIRKGKKIYHQVRI